MTYQTILLEKKDGVGLVTLNRPERLNAFTNIMAKELMDAFDDLQSDNNVGVLVITGAGRAFCAGEDVKERPADPPGTVRSKRSILRTWRDPFPEALSSLPKPVIAAINGPAVGQGLSLALACDIRIGSESARLGAVWTKRGIPPESAGAYNLTRIVGLPKACELVFTGRIVEAPEAHQIGLLNQLVPNDRLMPATMEMASTIASGPPIAIGLAKRAIYTASQVDLATHRMIEALSIEYCFGTADRQEGINSFLEKRPPKFRGE